MKSQRGHPPPQGLQHIGGLVEPLILTLDRENFSSWPNPERLAPSCRKRRCALLSRGARKLDMNAFYFINVGRGRVRTGDRGANSVDAISRQNDPSGDARANDVSCDYGARTGGHANGDDRAEPGGENSGSFRFGRYRRQHLQWHSPHCLEDPSRNWHFHPHKWQTQRKVLHSMLSGNVP